MIGINASMKDLEIATIQFIQLSNIRTTLLISSVSSISYIAPLKYNVQYCSAGIRLAGSLLRKEVTVCINHDKIISIVSVKY